MTFIPPSIATTQSDVELEWQDLSIELLNDIFTPLDFKARIRLLYKYFKADDVLYTSSFGTKSVFLLHLLKQLKPEPIHLSSA